MKKLAFVFILVLSLSACEDQSPCEALDTGSLCVENTLAEAVKIYIDGDYYKTIMSGEEECINGVPAGETEVSAYGAISNKYYFQTTVVEACRDMEVSF